MHWVPESNWTTYLVFIFLVYNMFILQPSGSLVNRGVLWLDILYRPSADFLHSRVGFTSCVTLYSTQIEMWLELSQRVQLFGKKPFNKQDYCNIQPFSVIQDYFVSQDIRWIISVWFIQNGLSNLQDLECVAVNTSDFFKGGFEDLSSNDTVQTM